MLQYVHIKMCQVKPHVTVCFQKLVETLLKCPWPGADSLPGSSCTRGTGRWPHRAFHAAFLEDLKKATPSCQTYDHKSIIYGSLNQPSKSSRDTGHFQDQSYTFMTQTPTETSYNCHTNATQPCLHAKEFPAQDLVMHLANPPPSPFVSKHGILRGSTW